MQTRSINVATSEPAQPRADAARATQVVLNRLPPDVYLALAILLIFALLHNGYWSKGGDSDVYLSMARNLATHRGYRFNDQPVAVVTPVWPYVLAGAMRYVSTSFNMLKLLPMLLLGGGLLVWYRILLRSFDAKFAAVCTLLSALLVPVATLSYLFHTDSLFTLVAALAVLVALQINEGRPALWRVPALLALCALGVGVRWAGLLWWPLVAGALLNGRQLLSGVTPATGTASLSATPGTPRLAPSPGTPGEGGGGGRTVSLAHVLAPAPTLPRSTGGGSELSPRVYLCTAATFIVTLATFIALRKWLFVPDALINPDPNLDDSLARSYSLFNKAPTFAEYARRAAWTGQWISGLLWLPLTEAGKLARFAMNLIGFGVLAAVVARIPAIIRRREWLVVGAAAYVGWLVIDWPAPVARYMVPLAPLALAWLYTCVRDATAAIRHDALHRLALSATVAAIAGVVLVNLAFYAVEVYVAQSRDYYGTYQAGLSRSLVDASYYLNRLNLRDGKIVISRFDSNFSRTKYGNQWLRATNVLTDRGIKYAPLLFTDRPPDGEAVKWMEFVGAEWFLYRPPSMVMWHFDARRLPVLGRMMHLPPPNSGDTDWRLYQIKDHKAVRVIPPHVNDWPRTVPGMEHGTREMETTLMPSTRTAVFCHPERTREGSRAAKRVSLPEILREYAQDDRHCTTVANYVAESVPESAR